MTKILSVLVILCVVVAAAYCAASWWVGAQAQKNFEAVLAQKEAALPQWVEFTTKSYERGIFHSTAVISVVLKKPVAAAGPEEALRFTMLNSVQHGPLVFSKVPHTPDHQPRWPLFRPTLSRGGSWRTGGKSAETGPRTRGFRDCDHSLPRRQRREFPGCPPFKKKLTTIRG